MAQSVADSKKTGSLPANQPLVPPDERFWQRYSRHGELPLSGATSLALHLLVFGLAVLAAWLAYAVFSHTSRSLPVEAVRLDIGGGGGDPRAKGEGPGRGEKVVEEGNKTEEAPANTETNDKVERPDLKVDPAPQKPPQFSDADLRRIQRSDTASSQAFERLAKANIRVRLPDGKPAGRGQGGTGSGGGSGDGQGTGTGNGRGEGHGKLTQREKRMLRWSMLFNSNSGPDYLSQLQGLGAILAIPVREGAKGPEYQIVRDLSARPAKLLDEDISKIERIYWIDDKPQSVMDVMAVLRLPLQPSHFVAFMPKELEDKLLQLEIAYFEKRHKGRGEDDILKTKFKINRTRKGYIPEVVAQEVK
ncbi:MAG TPA: hypothetical protein VN688_12695 [Gemmataceae bacterium]|nr:hypothetical protein [Gemmataceae bacterium]